MFSEKGVLEEIYEIRDGESTIAGDILSNVISRVGLGGGEPLSHYTRGILSTGYQSRRG